jgi:hypothetical protein
MLTKIILLLALLFTLSSCGGTNTSSDASLEGTWYFKAHTTPATYVGQHVIEQNGDNVLITYCDRTTYALRLVGAQLIDPQGTPYYLQPSGTDLLAGAGDTEQRSEARRFSRSTRFEAGSLAVAVPSTEALFAEQDVCAAKDTARFASMGGQEIFPERLVITAPYKTTFVRIEIAFQTLAAGDYSVQDFDTFVSHPGGAAFVELTSPAYAESLAQELSQPRSGEVHVRGNATEGFNVEGSVLTTTGKHVLFAADVVLKQPQ